MPTVKANGKTIDSAAIVKRLNQLQERICTAREFNDKACFEYYSGAYDGYRVALAAMGYSVVYSATNEIIGIEER